ncbi:MAG: type I-E CRISPR-associated protein Cse2/CasB [Mycolicibacterium sp.]|nr:type I-E CRISPR-associated protein Cse2/CasB [Mycolicibacterium sp.]
MNKQDKKLNKAVTKRVRELQRKAIDETTRYADVPARLARLRRGINAEPGSVPEIWSDTIGALPEDLWGRGDNPSRYEQAAHTAITLFSLHLQSARAAVHRPGISLGSAARQLASARTGVRGQHDPAIFKRFQALATASSREELNHHLRSLITLMRGEGVQLDYGLLAADLAGMQTPRQADRIRLRWGRDYHRVSQDDEQDTVDPSNKTEEE